MAGTATHLAVADKMYELFGGEIRNPALFYSGNIAPDAIHARGNYQRSDKKRTHLTEGISGGDFQNPEKRKIFHSRVNDFIKAYYHAEDEYADLYLGYIIHLITDELFNIHVRERFVISMEKDGIQQEDPEFFRRIIRDIESVDHMVVTQYPYQQNVRQLLSQVWDYEIEDYITAEEINVSKQWVIDTFLTGNGADCQPLYYDYAAAYDFILYAVQNIVNRLSNGIDYIKLLPHTNRILFSTTENSRFVGDGQSVIRSDAILQFHEGDLKLCGEYRIQNIIDLRSGREALQRPCAVPETLRYCRIPLHETGILPRDSEKVGEYYFSIAQDGEVIRKVLRRIASSDGATIYFCRAGKDRTGVITAILLALCGYSDEYIINDYVETADRLKDTIAKWLPLHPDYTADVILPLPKHICKFLTLLRGKYATAHAYCKTIGISDAEIETIRRRIRSRV